MKKVLAILLAVLTAAVLMTAVSAVEVLAEYQDYATGSEPFDDPGEGYATVEEAASAIGKTALTGIYTFVDGTEGNNAEGPENLWDNNTTTKFCTGVFPNLSVAHLDGKYAIDGLILATANDNSGNLDRSPYEWAVFGSNDGSSWTQIAYGDDYFFEEVDFTYFPVAIDRTDAYEFLLFQSEGALSGCFQVSECVICGEKTGDASVDVTLPEAPATAEFIDFESNPIANNGKTYDDAAVAADELHVTPIKNPTFLIGTYGNNNEGPENIWDDDVTTKWCYVSTVDLVSDMECDQAYPVEAIILATANDNAEYNGRSPSQWALFGSNDNENWELIVDGDASFFTEENFTYYAAPVSKEGSWKYFKFEVVGSESGTFQMSECVICTTYHEPTPEEIAAAEAAAKAAEEAAAKAAEEAAARAAETAAKLAAEAEAKAAEKAAAEAAAAEAAAAEAAEAGEAAAEATVENAGEIAKKGCGSFLGGSMIVLTVVLGSAWVSRRKD